MTPESRYVQTPPGLAYEYQEVWRHENGFAYPVKWGSDDDWNALWDYNPTEGRRGDHLLNWLKDNLRQEYTIGVETGVVYLHFKNQRDAFDFMLHWVEGN